MKTKLFLVLALSAMLTSCGDRVRLQDKFISVESVQVLNDSSYCVNLKCSGNGSTIGTASFVTPYRYAAGDTLWSETQLKKHYNNLSVALSVENQKMKDSAFFYRVSLGNKIEELQNQIRDLQSQNNALQKALVKLK